MSSATLPSELDGAPQFHFATRVSSPRTRVHEDLCILSAICFHVSNDYSVDQEVVQTLYSLQQPTVPRRWTKLLVPLLRVSRAFHRACLRLLWKTLDTVEPLLAILGGEKTLNENGTSSWAFPNGISPPQWSRFLFYSSNIESLILGPGHTLDVHWVAFLSSTIPSLFPWFSGVKRLYLTSTDPFPLFLATSLMPHVRTVSLGLHTQPHSDLAVLGAARNSVNMVGLRIEHLTSPQTLRIVSQFKLLKYLYIKIPANAPASLLVESITDLQALRSLTIMQSNAEVEDKNPLSTLEGYNSTLSKPSQFHHLRWVAINANAITQCVIATHLAATGVESLSMSVFSNKGAAYLVPAIAVYAQRNPALSWLQVEVGMSDAPVSPEEVGSLQSNPVFDSTHFLKALAVPLRLRGLLIDGVPFFDKHIVQQVLRTIRGLVHLDCFQFLPLPVTPLEGDQLARGSLSDLKKLARYNTTLGSLETLLDVSNVPALKDKYDSPHQLGKLSIRTNGNPPTSVKHRLEVAKFLDAVFPYLEKVSSPIRDIEDGPESTIWAEVQEMVFSNQLIRAGVWSKISGEEEGQERVV